MVITRKLSEAVPFTRRCLELLLENRSVFLLFVGVSVLAALTEGVSVSLLVPILDAQAGSSSFASIPLLGEVSALFAAFSPTGRVQAAAIAIAIVVILRNLLQYAVDYLSATLPLRLEQKLNSRSYAALMGVEIGYIHRTEYGVLQNGIGGWSHRVTVMLTSAALILSNLMTVGVYVLLMMTVSWRLTLLAVLFMLTMSLLLRWLTLGALRHTGERLSTATSRLNQLVMESLSGMKLIRLSAGEKQMSDAYAAALNDAIDNQRVAAKIQAISAPALSSCATLFICALLFGSSLLDTRDPSGWIGTILLFLFLLFRLMGPVSAMNIARNRIVNHMPAFEELNEFYRVTDALRQKSGAREAQLLREGIVLEGLTFMYRPEAPPALRDVSFKIAHGNMVAVVGPSGAGKTTLTALLVRLYDPQQGKVLIDGVDLRELDVRSWRKRVAVVSQDIFLFNDTVANNVRFGQGDVPIERVIAACRLASAEEFIEKLPQGYDTPLGDRGVRLSGGQQQRIAIARAVLANPDLLIFDEATSQLDTFTEQAIQRAIEHLAKDRTVLVIAHRLSTVIKADRIFVLDGGRLIEEGTHRDLLARRGRYAEMVQNQQIGLVDDAVSAVPA